ncbi:MAG TPA: hypothetical protein PLM62_09810, partial [Zoogloea sp.]|nr:hypothetical protein [Zoogloea sp.]
HNPKVAGSNPAPATKQKQKGSSIQVLEPFCLVRPAEGAGRRFVTVISVPWGGPGPDVRARARVVRWGDPVSGE